MALRSSFDPNRYILVNIYGQWLIHFSADCNGAAESTFFKNENTWVKGTMENM